MENNTEPLKKRTHSYVMFNIIICICAYLHEKSNQRETSRYCIKSMNNQIFKLLKYISCASLSLVHSSNNPEKERVRET